MGRVFETVLQTKENFKKIKVGNFVEKNGRSNIIFQAYKGLVFLECTVHKENQLEFAGSRYQQKHIFHVQS